MENTIIKNAAHATLKIKSEASIAITTEIIREEVMRFQVMYPLDTYPSINWEGIINELESHYTITIGSSETLYNHKIPWIRNYKQNNPNLSDFPFWNNYKRHLFENQQLPQTVIDEIDQSTDAILDGMSNPRRNR